MFINVDDVRHVRVLHVFLQLQTTTEGKKIHFTVDDNNNNKLAEV